MQITGDFSLSEALRKRARLTPNRTFVKFEGAKISYGEMDRRADAVAAWLADKDYPQGARIAILAPNCPENIAAYFGIVRAGCIVLPLNTLLGTEETAFILDDAGVTLCFFHPEFSDKVASLRESAVTCQYEPITRPFPSRAFDDRSSPDDVCTFLYTSGTTGRPKAAMLTGRNIVSNAAGGISVIKVRHSDRMVVFLPLFHSFTFTVCVVIPILTGCSISLIPNVKPFSRVVKRIISDRVTLFIAIPTVYKILAEKKIPFLYRLFMPLRLCVSGAAPLPARVIEDFERVFRIPILEGYGLTEASPIVSINPAENRKVGTVGIPIPGVEVKIIDDAGSTLPPYEPGEIAVRGPNIMKGYWNRPDDTAATVRDGWLHTGDIGIIEKSGHIQIIDRKKDMIIVDGMNIYPTEIEDVLYRHPDVSECAMLGIPHDDGVELPVMFVVTRDGRKIPSRELREFLSPHVAHYKLPRRFVFLDELPRNPTGKILKKELRRWKPARTE